jgi:hypothetical protein
VQFALSVLAAVLRDGWSDACAAFVTVLFAELPPEAVDGLAGRIVAWEWLPVCERLAVVRLSLGGYRFTSLGKICEFVVANLMPDGLNFLCALLASEKAELCGLAIVCGGAAQAIRAAVEKRESVRHFPRILHLFRMAVERLRAIRADGQAEFEAVAARVAMQCLTRISAMPQKAAVVVPACWLLRSVDRGVLEQCFLECREEKELFQAVRSPKQKKKAEIVLRAFSEGNVRAERAAPGGWQSLDVSDD